MACSAKLCEAAPELTGGEVTRLETSHPSPPTVLGWKAEGSSSMLFILLVIACSPSATNKIYLVWKIMSANP